MSGPESLIALGPQPGLHAQAVDGPRTRTSSSLRKHRPGQRLWVLLHAQFLLRGPATSGDDIRLVEDDYQRMAVLRREGHG